jgi:hypothetical protein
VVAVVASASAGWKQGFRFGRAAGPCVIPFSLDIKKEKGNVVLQVALTALQLG